MPKKRKIGNVITIGGVKEDFFYKKPTCKNGIINMSVIGLGIAGFVHATGSTHASTGYKVAVTAGSVVAGYVMGRVMATKHCKSCRI